MSNMHIVLCYGMSLLGLRLICIFVQVAYAPILHSKFLHLKYLSISLNGAPFSPAYDYLSLASFLDAAPILESFHLDVSRCLYCCDITSCGGTIT